MFCPHSLVPSLMPVTSVCPLLWAVRVNTPFLCGSDLWRGFWLCIASLHLMSDQTLREMTKKCQVLFTARNIALLGCYQIPCITLTCHSLSWGVFQAARVHKPQSSWLLLSKRKVLLNLLFYHVPQLFIPSHISLNVLGDICLSLSHLTTQVWKYLFCITT